MRKSAWLATFRLDAMALILSLTVASALGTLIGNMILFWIIGVMAQRQQKRQEAELARLQSEFLEMRQREVERMEKYAKMEG